MKYALYTFILGILCSCGSGPANSIDLSGVWKFRIDSLDHGVEEKWFDQRFEEEVVLPGSMVENDKGSLISLETEWTGGIKDPEWHKDPNYLSYQDSGNIRFPFWLQPNKKYTGAAWYSKTVLIPRSWKDKSILLYLERPHWESTVWINGQRIGMQNSLAVAHAYDLTLHLTPGKNSIAIRIDNRVKEVDPGVNSHSITDHTQTNWNGIVGEIALRSAAKIRIKNIEVFPNLESRTAEIKAEVINLFSEPERVEFSALAILKSTGDRLNEETYSFSISPGLDTVTLNYALGKDALLWDEFHPNVYQLDLKLKSGKGSDFKSTDFGLREFRVDSTYFTVNGRPVFLRGTLECAIFPLTGYPPTEKDYWEKIYTAIKEHGLNHLRFHSWCPPEAAFIIADSMGIYLMVECSSWANQSTELGSGLPVDQYIWDESKRIVKAYGNHPSFVMMAYGNEPGGSNRDTFLSEFVRHWKAKDARRLYTSGAGWPLLPENEYHVTHREARIQGWGEELNSIINSEPPKTTYDWSAKVQKEGKPIVSHEIGQWCAYPNLKEIEKYTGILKAKNFELFNESLDANLMGHLADSFLMASGKLQALCYKADIEAALRTPGFAGFQLLDLHDFPGQGTALVGVLDPFWEEKGYISPEEYRRFCNTTVPLARLEKRIFTEGETMKAAIEIAHFGPEPLVDVIPSWKIRQHDEILASGILGKKDIPIGNAFHLGEVSYEFPHDNMPRKLTLEVSAGVFENTWDVWVYPEKAALESAKIKIVEDLDAATIHYLNEGGKVLLSLGKGRVSPEMGGDVGVGFSSIFWNTAWTGGQKPHTLGILCNPIHPALEYFPTEYHSNWQWWDAMHHSDAIQLDDFPVELKPVVRIIDDWVSNRRLALLFEANMGKGSLFISGVDLVNNLENRPEARQLRSSILKYMESSLFQADVTLDLAQVQSILK